MKIRIFNKIVDGVFNTRIHTEDWSELDKELMLKYGEPEINIGGEIEFTNTASTQTTVTLNTVYKRIMTESPFVQKFDARDFGGVEDFSQGIKNAKTLASLWSASIEDRIIEQIQTLRSREVPYSTETVTEY